MGIITYWLLGMIQFPQFLNLLEYCILVFGMKEKNGMSNLTLFLIFLM